MQHLLQTVWQTFVDCLEEATATDAWMQVGTAGLAGCQVCCMPKSVFYGSTCVKKLLILVALLLLQVLCALGPEQRQQDW